MDDFHFAFATFILSGGILIYYVSIPDSFEESDSDEVVNEYFLYFDKRSFGYEISCYYSVNLMVASKLQEVDVSILLGILLAFILSFLLRHVHLI